ncbi:PhzF family phenazine biosynthesis protein [Porphyrobacter sp. CACIAM 03H1]|uniref:PhzF family phenazine biosynthesis protein n=1 Tax=Porphyrobacter sp. CACIAM 03H1 TaxID=2003315 RepID=UPI000B5A565A|nr:PhzF family phenazine biosynthesis protein [Porphyrobacter sp. CACIAM 03H1]ASJ89759.1 PhzF family phenazine biosynthesis protein [Porphyrobacter sp. CACIAM 03H1]
MPQKILYWHVDAFSAQPFGGNQAAVMVLDEWLPDDVLVKIGGENLFAETAFVVRDTRGAADWELRWCTPTYEIALCGHATLASGHVLLQRDGGERITFRTRKSGILEVVRAGDGYELALPAIATAPRDYPEAVALLGAQPLEVWRNDSRYNIFLFESEAAIRALDPDIRGLGALGTDQFICTAPGDSTDIVSRVFVPGGGVDEDSVTGSAHAVLTPYWAKKLGRDSFTAHQASQRGGDLTLRLDGDRAWLGGPCVTVVEGAFYL